jgi:hypothetical protein
MPSENPSKKRPYVRPRLIDLTGENHIAEGATIPLSCVDGSDHSTFDSPLDNPNCMTGSAPVNNCLAGGAAIGRNCNMGSVPRE